MTITLYTNNSEKIRLDKSLTELKTMTGDLRDDCSITDPTILVSDIGDIVGSVNYAYIAEFKRYYFVQADYVRTNIWRLTMHVDVLTSWASNIRQQKGIIERNESQYNLKLNDGLFVTQQNPRIATFSFPQGFNQWDFVLAVSGSAGEVDA